MEGEVEAGGRDFLGHFTKYLGHIGLTGEECREMREKWYTNLKDRVAKEEYEVHSILMSLPDNNSKEMYLVRFWDKKHGRPWNLGDKNERATEWYTKAQLEESNAQELLQLFIAKDNKLTTTDELQ